MKNKVCSLLVVFAVLLSLLPSNCVYAEAVASGSCGNSAYWSYDGNGTLTVSGTGYVSIGEFNWISATIKNAPWKAYNDEIRHITVDEGISVIGPYVFNGLTNLEDISIPDSLLGIAYFAFFRCKSLKEVNISKYMENIGYAFGECDSLERFNVDEENPNYKSVNGILYNNSGSSLIAFPNLAEYSDDVLKNVTTIASAAFFGNTTIDEITFPDTITNMGDYVFYNSKIKRFNFSDTAFVADEHLGKSFVNCSELEEIVIPASWTRVFSFSGCSKVDRITFLGEPTSIAGFEGTNISEIDIPDSVSALGTFYNCKKLRQIHLPSSMVSVPESMFNKCTSLESINLPANVKKIGRWGFQACTSLKSIIIPASVTSIGYAAFDGCNELDTIYFTGTQEEWQSITIDSSNNSYIDNANIIYDYVPSGASINKTTLSLHIGDTETLQATFSPSETILWTSDNENVATVSNGFVTAVSVGSAVITASNADGSKSVICTVNVLPVQVSEVSLDQTELLLHIGESTALNAIVLPNNATDKTITWTSDNSEVVSVSDNGVITALSSGSANITVASSNDITATCAVTVQPVSVASLSIDKPALSIIEGNSEEIHATVLPNNATNKNINWTSSDESIATVTNGTVKGISPGTAVIIATTEDGDFKKYCAVTVLDSNVSVTGITLSSSTLNIVEGGSETLTATVSPNNASNKNVIWESNDETVATVNNGEVTGVAPGTAVIVATTEDGGKIAACIVYVAALNQETVAAPLASVLSGVVRENTKVILLTATRNATLYYTTDGSVPTVNSTKYTAPINITKGTTIKAIAVKSGMKDSEIASFTYTLADPELPFVNVITNVTANKGDVATVSVNISENSNFAGGSFNLVYDNEAVELLSASSGSIISSSSPQVNNQYATNKIRTVWAGMNEINTGGELLNAQFRILESNDDAAYFTLEKVKLADSDANKLSLQSSDGILLLKDVPTVPSIEISDLNVSDKITCTINLESPDTINGIVLVGIYDNKDALKGFDLYDAKEEIDVVMNAIQGTKIKAMWWEDINNTKPVTDAVEKRLD